MTSNWYKANKSYLLNYKRMWRVDNPDKAREIDKRNHQKHKQQRNEYSIGYYYKNRAKILAKMKENYQKKKHEK